MIHPSRIECQKISSEIEVLIESQTRELEKTLGSRSSDMNEQLSNIIARIEKLEIKLAKMRTGIAWRRALEQQNDSKVADVVKQLISLESRDLWTKIS